jgi:hypothetical protein
MHAAVLCASPAYLNDDGGYQDRCKAPCDQQHAAGSYCCDERAEHHSPVRAKVVGHNTPPA